jgi:hypothetical protein
MTGNNLHCLGEGEEVMKAPDGSGFVFFNGAGEGWSWRQKERFE